MEFATYATKHEVANCAQVGRPDGVSGAPEGAPYTARHKTQA